MDEALSDIDDKRFAANFKERRLAQGISQAAVAERVSVSLGRPFHQQTVTRIENGQQPAKLGEAQKLAQSIGADLSALLRPRGLARQAWRIQHYVTEAREAHKAARDSTERLTLARLRLQEAIDAVGREGAEDELEAEITIGRRALKDTEKI